MLTLENAIDIVWWKGLDYKDAYHSNKTQKNTAQVQSTVDDILETPTILFIHQGQEFSIIDLLQLDFENINDFIDFLNENCRINIANEKWIEVFKKVLDIIISIYFERYNRNYISIFDKIDITSKHDIYSLFNWEKGVPTPILCDIKKFFFLYARLLQNTLIRYMDENHQEVISKLSHCVTGDSNTPNIQKFEGCFSYDNIQTPVLCISRSKWIDSILWKETADVKYLQIENMSDLHAMEITIDGDEYDLLILIQQYFQSGIIKDMTVSQKNMFPAWIDGYKNILSQGFYSEIKWKFTSIEDMVKKKISSKYQDVKIKWEVEIPHPKWWNRKPISVPIEIKFVLKGNQNEMWLALQPRYNIEKRFRELTRLWSLIRLKDIVSYVNEFFECLDEYLNFKWIGYSEYVHSLFQDLQNEWCINENFNINDTLFLEKLHKWLFKFFVKDLVPVRKEKNWKVYYVHKNYFSLSEKWLLPEVYNLTWEKLTHVA